MGVNSAGEEPRVGPEPKVKSFEIGKRLVYGAWEKVRANGGAPGVDANVLAFSLFGVGGSGSGGGG